MRPKYPEIGKRIAEVRKSKGLKQKDCLEPLGDITIQMISSWENGHVFPSPTYLIKMSQFFNVSLDYLILGIKNDSIYKKPETFKEVFEHLSALKSSGLFEFKKFKCDEISGLLVELSTKNETVFNYLSDLERLESALDLLGEQTFYIKVNELLNKYDYKIK